MAPVPKSSCVLQHTKCVELDVHIEEGSQFKCSSSPPPFEKMISCEYSIEVSSESSEEEEGSPWTRSSFSKRKTTEGKGFGLFHCDHDQYTKLFVSLQDKQPNSIDYCDDSFKLGALDKGKKQSPVESDETSISSLEKPSKLSKGAFETSWSVSSPVVEEKTCESEHSESKGQLLPTVKKPGTQKRKSIGATIKKAVAKPKNNAVSAEKKIIFKRHSIGKKKRNTYEIFVPDSDIKLIHKPVTKKKPRKKQEKSQFVSKRKSSTFPSYYSCVDSGVSSGNSYSAGNSQDGSYSNGANGGTNCGGGGGGGFYKKGGLGGHGGDENEDKKPVSTEDINMDDDDEEDDDGDIKMNSKEGSAMDCNEGQETEHSIPWKEFQFKTQHLQHGAYCCDDKCQKPLCPEVKREIQHIQNHKCNAECHRCLKTLNLLKYHAASCARPSCRVHLCNKLREKRDVLKEPVQIVTQPPPQVPIWNSTQRDLDGLVVYNNTGFNIGRFFQENINYMKGDKVGNGKNGHVYKAHVRATSPLYDKPMVVKETEYILSSEERGVYNTIGEHPNIVKHHMVTMRGNYGQACIFMEQCDKSLKDLCKEHRMDDREAIFYWWQVVDAVKHIHANGIIHKDIKAQNVLLSELPGDGEHFRAKLADFDAAKILENEYTISGLKPLGTRGFASPEVMNSLPHGRPADIFGLGCLLMELKGLTPKQGQLKEQLEELRKNSPFLSNIVQCCVLEDPTKRPTAEDIRNFLNNFIPDELH